MKNYLGLYTLLFTVILAGSNLSYGQKKPVSKPTVKKTIPDTANFVAANPPKDTIVFKMGRLVSSLDNATGWMRMGSKGKWASSPNRIPYDNPDYNNELYDKYKLGTEHFKRMLINEVTLNGKPYYALTILYYKGYYKDEKNEMDFRYYLMTDYYIFEREWLSRIVPDSVAFNKPYTASIPVEHTGTFPFNASELSKRMAWTINNVHRMRKAYDTTVRTFFQFSLYPVKDKRGRFMRFNTALAYAQEGTQPKDANYADFQYKYYEMPFDRFKQFVKPRQ